MAWLARFQTYEKDKQGLGEVADVVEERSNFIDEWTILDELMEVVDPSRLNDRMRVWFVQAVTKEEAFARFLRDRCDGLRKSIIVLWIEKPKKKDHGDMIQSLDRATRNKIDAICCAPKGWIRSLIADYEVSLMVLVWTVVSYAPAGSVAKGIPRRLFSPNLWSPGAYDNWDRVIIVLLVSKESRDSSSIWLAFAGF
ncbi:boron transporter 1-like protein [Tanacetum coccineum]